ncbi:DUF4148 domain-containing protein [Aquabacterium sp. J223]|uniref:DUF4148 domain-containing protein n=1 Tax=Aquabacterium sp. J223 TaxID=2898431 RepID=UPI0021ADB82F|nr:DUF4148 domain-containing protein [Aquabacterium sp. J223]UUX95572.1 DUF4148 domain-containing protein [Aquabacterium sp. J223]
MTSRHLSTITVAIALLSSLAALSPAQAADNGGLTRADVQAEAQRALRAGELPLHRDDDKAFAAPAAAASQGASREQVRAELARARTADVPQYRVDGYQVFAEPVTASTRTRAEVRAEYEQARASGELDRINALSYGHQLPQTGRVAAKPAPVVRAERTPVPATGERG